MPRKPTPAGKQRVRTGCLTCRRRRRKCDEQKPRCANCEAKGIACKYGPDPNAPGGARRVYSSITFVDDSPLAHGLTGKKERSDLKNKPVTESQPDGNVSTAREILTPSSEPVYQNISPSGENRTSININDLLTSNVPIGNSPGPPSLQPASRPHGSFAAPAIYQQKPSRPILSNSSHETDLLRHFRYSVGPWIDVDDPDCDLGIQVLLLARSNRPLQAAILALSAGQRSLLSLPPHGNDFGDSIRFAKEADQGLVVEPELVRRTGQALLLLQRLLPSGPQQWRSILFAQIDSEDFLSPTALAEKTGEGLFWLYFRLDLAASIAASKSPIIPFRTFLQRDGSPIHPPQSSSEPSSVRRANNHALCLLGHCLALLYADPDMSSPQTADSPVLAAFPSLRQSHFISEWTFLWTDCQKWYNERPIDAQQIMEVRGGEADQIDPEHDSSFPILIYTTPMALVANAVYHITSFLLLTHKPRMLKSLPGPRRFTSHMWHAQSIAGIAVSNDSHQQWDPILVTGLLLVAREMTHESQQTVLLERFRRITATTGMSLVDETKALQAMWNIARFDEEADNEDEGTSLL